MCVAICVCVSVGVCKADAILLISVHIHPSTTQIFPRAVGTGRPLRSLFPLQVRRRPNCFISSRRSTDAWRRTSARQKFTSCHRNDINSRFVFLLPHSVIDSVECWRICCAVELAAFQQVSVWSLAIESTTQDSNLDSGVGGRLQMCYCMKNI